MVTASSPKESPLAVITNLRAHRKGDERNARTDTEHNGPTRSHSLLRVAVKGKQ